MKARWALVIAGAAVAIALVIGMISTSSHRGGESTRSNPPHEGGTLKLDGPDSAGYAVVPRRPVHVRKREPYVVIDRYCNRLFLRTQDSVLLEALCSTGSGGELADDATGRHWKFNTPSGVFPVHTKLEEPWWRKPDWAFVEEGEPIPTRESERLDNEMMGDYAIGFGDGYFIHGTIYERLLGTAVTHGCIRLSAEDLKVLYDHVRIGTFVFIY